ncbi:MAG: oligopeptide transporter, OPT family [Candidatus Eisenbacteria sp.]|nr:oligopeptide transporter, OPT family [Candidatus Eisenbacteria bacterium]
MARYKPFVPPETSMKEFSVGAILLGLVMCVILGAANAYLGLKAGMTIAATYPAAVIGMAAIRLWKGTILEENLARTVGSIGESVAAGAIFTIPAFFLAGVWTEFGTVANYMKASVIMLVGGFIGIFFVTILRRVMVEDADLVFPESVAAGEIHKAGRSGASGAKYLFGAMGLGALVQTLGKLSVFAASWDKFIFFKKSAVSLLTGTGGLITKVEGAGGALLTTPGVSPAYMGVGYIIGPGLASLNFSGGLLSWGLFVPLLLYFVGPDLVQHTGAGGQHEWIDMAFSVWKFMVRPIAIGGMLMSAAYTLYGMRKSLATGLGRAVNDVKRAGAAEAPEERTEKDISFKWVFIGIVVCAVATYFVYYYFAQNVLAALVATVVMVIAGFFFAAVSGYLVGILGSSNNPISGFTLSTLVVAALLMVILGMKGAPGVAATLGVAAVICVAAAVAGEMLQDLKVGHILGGTPWKMQVGDFIGVVLASFTMFIPLVILHQGDINAGGQGFGGRALPAPQAGLMALLSQGIVGGEMAWPLLIVGILMAIALILVQVRSPMLVCVGMYLPLETTFAIFIGGIIRWVADTVGRKRNFNDAQKTRVMNTGVLVAAGLIAGEALMGLVFAAMAFANTKVPAVFQNPSFITSLFVFVILGFVLVYYPVKTAGDPDEPPPPSAVT